MTEQNKSIDQRLSEYHDFWSAPNYGTWKDYPTKRGYKMCGSGTITKLGQPTGIFSGFRLRDIVLVVIAAIIGFAVFSAVPLVLWCLFG